MIPGTCTIQDEEVTTQYVFDSVFQPAVVSMLAGDPRIKRVIPAGDHSMFVTRDNTSASQKDVEIAVGELIMLHEPAVNGRRLVFTTIQLGVILISFSEAAAPQLSGS